MVHCEQGQFGFTATRIEICFQTHSFPETVCEVHNLADQELEAMVWRLNTNLLCACRTVTSPF